MRGGTVPARQPEGVVARDGRPSRHYRDANAAHCGCIPRGTDRLDIRAKRALRLFRAACHAGGRAAADCRGNVACAAHAGRHRDAVRRPSGNACRLSWPRRRGVPCAARRAGPPDGDAVRQSSAAAGLGHGLTTRWGWTGKSSSPSTKDSATSSGSRRNRSSANIGPVEAYTQIQRHPAVPAARATETGYANLLIAGDWVRNGYEVGSVEGAVLGGLQAAAAIIAEG